MKYHIPEAYKELYWSTIGFVVVVIIGTLGYPLLVDGITLFDAFYMTIITISTIGYGEMFDLTGNIPARIFTIFLAFVGVAILTYFLSYITAALLEGQINKSFKTARMENKIDKMVGHYIICGLGRVGNYIAGDLQDEEVELVCADKNEEQVIKLQEEHPKVPVLIGDCTQDEFLIKLGVKKAKGIFVTTRDDNANLMIVLTARQLNPYINIAAVCHFKSHEAKLKAVGANSVILPSEMGALRMAGEMLKPNVTTFLDILLLDEEKNLNIEEIKMGIACAGKTLGNFVEQKDGLILGIKERKEWKFNPTLDYPLTADSIIVMVTTPQKRKAIEQSILTQK